MPVSLYTEEHQALAAALGRFVEERIAPFADTWETTGEVPGGLRREAGALGYLTAGQQDAVVELAVAEALGRCGAAGVAVALLTTTAAVLPLLSEADGVAGCADLRERVAAGETVVTLAAADDGAADRPVARITATQTGDDVTLTGEEFAVPDARTAEAALVLAQASGAAALYLCHTAAPGWIPTATPAALGHASAGRTDVTLDGVPAIRLGLSAEAVQRALDRLRLMTAAAAVSGAWRTWERTRDYALEREAFGRPIARFQVNRHALAEAAGRLTAARQLVHEAAWRLGTGREDRSLIAAARRYATSTVMGVTDTCLQLYGGYGYAMEYDVQRDWRDARADRGATP